ncbi:hypothetical protein ODJ79_45525 [Actinoplanes sp. KI2]|uniref:hypothetical protein n=1 Tax=Actinoplanes sp. KI2 TaxID=2983315 RepID=UPI0021D608F6|nr:hypothetical protein [Actinoplanes sp. KI2]MCU7731019.1 hypothetical protein [Actinoplanes sp. KI2]
MAVTVTAMVMALLTDTVSERVGVLAAAVLLFTAVAGDSRAAAGVALIAWATGNGFLINRLGELRWRAPVDDRFAAGLLGAVALGMIIAQLRRGLRNRRRWRPVRHLLAAEAPRVAGLRPGRLAGIAALGGPGRQSGQQARRAFDEP